jgi:phosphoenolpyruvate synthase/pyruvate phosphate dikinase
MKRPAKFYYGFGAVVSGSASFEKVWGIPYPEIFVSFGRGNIFWCWKNEDYFETGERLIEKFSKKPGFGKEIRQRWLENKTKTIEILSAIEGKEPSGFSNEEIAGFMQRLIETEKINVGTGIVWNIFDIVLEAKIKSELEKKISPEKQKKEYNATFFALTTPPEMSFATAEEKELLQIGKRIIENEEAKELFCGETGRIKEELGKVAEINTLIQQHLKKFFWIHAGYSGGKKMRLDEVLPRLSELVKKNVDIGEKIAEIDKREKNHAAEKEKALQKISPGKEMLLALKIIEELGFLHDSKKEMQMRYFCAAEPLLLESAKRLGIDSGLVFYLTPCELAEALKKGKADKAELEKRMQKIVIENRAERIFCGKTAEKKEKAFRESWERKTENLQEVSGMSANLGTAFGKARILLSPKELSQMQQDEILVTGMTTPDLVPAMQKAAAIVTDEGGVLCHAAIVSRELGLPCVVGTKNATKVFKNGEMIEVRANHGIVRKV